MPNHSGGINNDRRPICGAMLVEIDSEATCESALGVKIGKHRIGDTAQAATEGRVDGGAVDANGQGLCVRARQSF